MSVVEMTYQNPDASAPLIVPVAVACNTADDDLRRNIRVNGARPLAWVERGKPLTTPLVIAGGGPSLGGYLKDIRRMQAEGAVVWALNGAAEYLDKNGIRVDAQIIADAKPETAQLVAAMRTQHILASQVDPSTLDRAVAVSRISGAPEPVLFHLLAFADMEDDLPPGRVEAGGYSLIGGGASVGLCALSVAEVYGFRDVHLFGYDSSHAAGESHAYDQPMNRFMPTVEVTWAGETFSTALAMKAQAEKFQLMARQLGALGVTLHVYGHGLLQAMYRTPVEDLGEQEKYTLLWQTDAYRKYSPGERVVPLFLERVIPNGVDGPVIDFGCGTGRAMRILHDHGCDVIGVDFADNCRDEDCLFLPFVQADLTREIPVRGAVGLCTDVMEHIRTEDVPCVIGNIMNAVSRCCFQISTVPDAMGALIGAPLHLTVWTADEWQDAFEVLGYEIDARYDTDEAVILIASNKESTK